MALEDPYKTLGVEKTATADEIRKAFRSAAKKSHPDLHPGDKGAEARFKALSAANELLSDPEKRARFDRGEIDASGAEPPPRSYYRDYAETGASGRYQRAEDEDFSDVFGAYFRQQADAQARAPRRGRDRQYHLDVPFLTTVTGATERLTLPGGAVLDVRIPPGLTDGQVLRLRGKGDPGSNGAPDGDALIEVSVFPHPFYRREGSNLVMELPVSFAEAVLGGKVSVPTPGGAVSMTIPARSDAGTRLRLRGRGVAAHGSHEAGDLYVTLKLVTGPVDPALEEFLRGWTAQQGFDPRAGLEDSV